MIGGYIVDAEHADAVDVIRRMTLTHVAVTADVSRFEVAMRATDEMIRNRCMPIIDAWVRDVTRHRRRVELAAKRERRRRRQQCGQRR